MCWGGASLRNQPNVHTSDIIPRLSDNICVSAHSRNTVGQLASGSSRWRGLGVVLVDWGS